MSVAEKARLAAAALRELAAAAVAESGGAPGKLAPAAITLTWRYGEGETELADLALKQAAELVSVKGGLRTGHAYCYGCASATCAHSAPPEHGSVFAGYSSMGIPEWEEFFNFLLQLEDTRTDGLFTERPEVLARVVGRQRLTAAQLATAGRNSLTYKPWGQVVAGYFHVGEQRAALTAQVVESREHRLHLQVLASALFLEALADTPETQRSPLYRVYDALHNARLALDHLSVAWQTSHAAAGAAGDRKIREEAFSVLRHLAHSLERKGRQEHGRTLHAERRGGHRPVHAAVDDVRAATPADFYRDAFRNSLVVAGKSGRCHVFSEEGVHVTSLMIGREELEVRVRRNRYVPLAAAASNALRARIVSRVAPEPGHDKS